MVDQQPKPIPEHRLHDRAAWFALLERELGIKPQLHPHDQDGLGQFSDEVSLAAVLGLFVKYPDLDKMARSECVMALLDILGNERHPEIHTVDDVTALVNLFKREMSNPFSVGVMKANLCHDESNEIDRAILSRLELDQDDIVHRHEQFSDEDWIPR